MRDPQSRLVIGPDQVVRQLRKEVSELHPLHSVHAKQWVSDGVLIPFGWLDSRQLVSPRIAFVSSPEEWCDAQLLAAAKLSLVLLERANAVGVDLKDASAWNVIFDGCKPVFCDLTSLEPMQTHVWWAAGQFVRHFVSPLWLASATGLQACDVFRMSRDGAQPELVRQTLGWRRYSSRCWPLVADAGEKYNSQVAQPVHARTSKYRQHMVASLRWMLAGVNPRKARQTAWGRYTQERDHYTTVALQAKREQVSQWLTQLKPGWTLDLGSNTGEFAQMAMNTGSRVIALDSDHDAVQAMYLQHEGQERLYPILAKLDDVHSGRGWSGIEHSGLAQRLNACADVVLMLALLHHLCIAAAVHMEQVAKFVANCTRRWLVVEWLESTDPQVRYLCAQHRREPEDFNIASQRQIFHDAGFVLCHELPLPGGHRCLALLEKRA